MIEALLFIASNPAIVWALLFLNLFMFCVIAIHRVSKQDSKIKVGGFNLGVFWRRLL